MRKNKKPPQLDLDLRRRTWGGARENAGRKRLRHKHDSAHRTRPRLPSYYPVHVVMRVLKNVPRLRQGRAYRVIRGMLARCLGDTGFRVCHVSIQSTHLHFLVEAADKPSLARGMQRLNILIARALNRELGRRGKLFAFRYHATQITNPAHARHSLAYVLNNWRRHRENEGCELASHAALDPYASGFSFNGWANGRVVTPVGFSTLPVSEPTTWLLRVGWQKYRRIDAWEIPGPMR